MSKDTQISLFGNNNPGNKPGKKPNNSLFILHNGKQEVMTPKQIFDDKKYNVLRAVTFSATGSFITRYLSNFKKIYIIEGLDNDKQTSSTYHNLAKVEYVNSKRDFSNYNTNKLINLLKHLNNTIRTKIVNKNFDLRVPVTRFIHEKFYLLSNTDTNDNRIVIGSANLSFQGFNTTSNQQEGLWIIDNQPDIFNKMLNHFHTLYDSTVTYLSSKIRSITKKQVKNIDPKHPKEQEVFTQRQLNQTKESIAEWMQYNLYNNTFDNNDKVNQQLLKYFKNTPIDKKEYSKHMAELKYNNDYEASISRNTVNRRSKHLKFKTPKAFKRGVPVRLRKLNIKTHQTSKVNHTKQVGIPMVKEVPQQRQEDVDNGLRIVKNGIATPIRPNMIKSISTHVTNEKEYHKLAVKHDLKVIDILMHSYRKYANANAEYESRAMEAILYGFTAMFLGDIRNQYIKADDVGEVRNIPLFFFIGGAKKTGKTSLLKFIAQSLGIYPHNYDGTPIIKRYSHIPITGRGSKKGIIDTIRNLMGDEFVTPILTNEIDSTFNYQNNGSQMIKDVAGEFGEEPDRQFSALIGVTNNDAYSLDSSAKDGRSYYLNFGNHIADNSQGSKLMTKLIKSVTNNLFLDFAKRFSNLILNNNITNDINKSHTNNKIDFLYWSRQVMRQIYKSVGMPVPDYLPNKLYNDTNTVGKNIWRVFYLSNYKQFRRIGKDKMAINISNFNDNSYHNNIGTYINSLPSPSIKLNKSNKSNTLVIRCSTFFKWIGLDNQKFLHEEKQKQVKEQEDKMLENDKAKTLAKKREQEIINGGKKPVKHGLIYRMFH